MNTAAAAVARRVTATMGTPSEDQELDLYGRPVVPRRAGSSAGWLGGLGFRVSSLGPPLPTPSLSPRYSLPAPRSRGRRSRIEFTLPGLSPRLTAVESRGSGVKSWFSGLRPRLGAADLGFRLRAPGSGSDFGPGFGLRASGFRLRFQLRSRLPASGFRLPASGFRLPASSSGLPAPSSGLPAPSSGLPAPSSGRPASGFRLQPSLSALRLSAPEFPAPGRRSVPALDLNPQRVGSSRHRRRRLGSTVALVDRLGRRRTPPA
ncbi:hypothetical protein FHR81_001592 [Actinoalloteichus hoggarensis]|uniref:Uncharacterized protein n=1 Tax=Actinoalloteichus hoggarensis TaxID=1470176 RepID=A0A221W0N8_9PSEU|nr:hypothetical protein AHOG_08395 [Actinoalloteichus hoggarensis]MBB5920562.1 hypothetical protein [Actinoalloteichus hoggarensis]